MADDKNAPEPTMEEILSSIRRIIAEDEVRDEGPSARAQAAPGQSPPADGVLELTDVVSDADPATPPRKPQSVPPAVAKAPSTRPAPSGATLRSDAQSVEPAAPPPASRPTRPESMPMADPTPLPPDAADGLISADVAKASTQALARLARSGVGSERRPAAAGGTNVEQFVADLLQPLLREWLERNLPGIVERIVEQEVKKLARRAELL